MAVVFRIINKVQFCTGSDRGITFPSEASVTPLECREFVLGITTMYYRKHSPPGSDFGSLLPELIRLFQMTPGRSGHHDRHLSLYALCTPLTRGIPFHLWELPASDPCGCALLFSGRQKQKRGATLYAHGMSCS